MTPLLFLSLILTSVFAQGSILSVERYEISCLRTGQSSVSVNVSVSGAITSDSSIANATGFIVSYFDPKFTSPLTSSTQSHISDINPVFFWSNGDASHSSYLTGFGKGNYLNSTTTNSYLSFAHNEAFSTNGSYSLMIWVKPTMAVVNKWVRLFGKGVPAARNYQLLMRWTNPTVVQLQMSRVNTPYNAIYSGYFPTIGDWTHVAGVWNRTTMTLYINGELVASSAVTVQPSIDTSNLTIGHAVTGYDTSWGALPQVYYDGAVLFNRNISREDIFQVMNLTMPSSDFISSTTDNTVQFTDVSEGVSLFRIQMISNGQRSQFISNVTWVTFNIQDSCPKPVYSVSMFNVSCTRGSDDGSPTINWQILDTSSTATSVVLSSFDPVLGNSSLLSKQAHISTFNPSFYWSNGESSHKILKTGVIWSNYFDGGTAFYEVPDQASIRMYGSYTVMIWVRPTAPGYGWARLIGKGGPTTFRNFGLWLNYNNANNTLFQMITPTGSSNARYYNNPPYNSWTHIAGVYTQRALQLYFNGTLVASSAFSQVADTTFSPLTIGHAKDYPAGHIPFTGYLDGAVLFNTALDNVTIQQVMNSTLPSLAFSAFSADQTGLLESTVYLSSGTARIQAVSDNKMTYLTNSTWFDFSCKLDSSLNISFYTYDVCSTSHEYAGFFREFIYTSNDYLLSADAYMISYIPSGMTYTNKASLADFSSVLFFWNRGYFNKRVTKYNSSSDNPAHFNSSYSTYAVSMDFSVLRLSSTFTFAAWIKPSSVPTSKALAAGNCDSDPNQCNYAIVLNPDLTITAAVGSAAAVGSTIDLDAWTHVVVVYTGSMIRLYYNLSLQISTGIPRGWFVYNTLRHIRIGTADFVTYFDGFIEGVSLFSGVLQDSQMSEVSGMTCPWCFAIWKVPDALANPYGNHSVDLLFPLDLDTIILTPLASSSRSLAAYNSTLTVFKPSIVVCNSCRPGTYSSGGLRSTICSACSPGYFASRNSSTTCDACFVGTYTPVTNSSLCLDCDLGRYVNYTGSTVCLNCTAGTYTDIKGLGNCKFCPRGTWNNKSLASYCSECSPGSYSPTEGLTFCSICLSGTFQKFSRSSACSNCEVGTFSNSTGLSACLSCPYGASTLVEGSSSLYDCGCVSGTYGKAYLGKSCAVCPSLTGITCAFNSSLPYVLSGYYRDPTNVSNVFSCIPSSACLETGTAEATLCSSLYQGSLCGECVSGYRRRANSCEECPPEAVKWLIISAAFIVIALFFYFFSRKNASIPVDLKIAFRALQILALYPSITAVWPDSLSNFLSILNFTNIDIDVAAIECSFKIDYWTRLNLKLSSPFILIAAIMVYGFYKTMRAYYIDKHDVKVEAQQFWKVKFVNYSIFVCLVLHTLLSSSVIAPFECVIQQDGSSIMLRNPSVTCYSEEWKQHFGGMVFFIIIWAAVFPLSILGILIRFRDNLDESHFLETYHPVLTKAYRNTFYFWEFVELLKRFFFILGLKLLPLSAKFAYLSGTFFVACMLVIYIIIDSIFLPYRYPSTSALSLLWYLVCIIVLISNALVFQSDGVSYDTQEQVGSLLIIVIVTAILYTCISVAHVIHKSKRHKEGQIHFPMEVRRKNQAKAFNLDLHVRLKMIQNSATAADEISTVLATMRSGVEDMDAEQKQDLAQRVKKYLGEMYLLLHESIGDEENVVLAQNASLITDMSLGQARASLASTVSTLEMGATNPNAHSAAMVTNAIPESGSNQDKPVAPKYDDEDGESADGESNNKHSRSDNSN